MPTKPERPSRSALGILARRFVGGVLVCQGAGRLDHLRCLDQGALAGVTLMLGLAWLPDVCTEIAVYASAPPAEF